ncbi:MAG: phytanoyl-CoA dioxygenase family protein [Rhizomicrobium sp.]
MARLGVGADTLTPPQCGALDADGCIVLRRVFDAAQCAQLLEAFERTYVPSHLWPQPRGHDTRHAMLNGEIAVRRLCLAPQILACVHHLLRRRFFLSDVQGRDPVLGGGYQRLHRDWVAPQGPAPMIIVLAFLDDFGPANGATRVLPGTHLLAGGADVYRDAGLQHPDQVVVEGAGGDVLVMNGYLAHSATQNTSGAHRRNLQVNFRGHEMAAPAADRVESGALPAEVLYLFGEDA